MKKEICDFLKVGQNIPIKLGDAVSLVYPYITLAICSFTCPNSSFPSMFLGFSIYVSNTTDKLKGTLCYKTLFNTSTIPSVFNTTCLVHGQYVIYNNERQPGVNNSQYSQYAWNEICELEVFGKYQKHLFLNVSLLQLVLFMCLLVYVLSFLISIFFLMPQLTLKSNKSDCS